jgi:hypothetical protein
LLKTFARKKEPIAEKIQPSRLMLPKDAVAAGIRNTPAPIIFPTTSAVLAHKPNSLLPDTCVLILFPDITD